MISFFIGLLEYDLVLVFVTVGVGGKVVAGVEVVVVVKIVVVIVAGVAVIAEQQQQHYQLE